jgi:hypothetical protein
MWLGLFILLLSCSGFPPLQYGTVTLKTAVGGEVLREDVEVAGCCEHPDAHLAVRGADGATA